MIAPDRFDQSTGPGHGRTYGVVVALVTDNQDPQGLGRVQVEFPTLSGDQVPHWARIATLMAGAGRGTFFLPEAGDEVLVAFECGDVTRPYVLGALWNGQDTPPHRIGDGGNDVRLIRSRSGHVIRLVDADGAEQIEVVDKSGENRVTIDTASGTVTVRAATNVGLEAPEGTIALNAKHIRITSTAGTKVEAQGGLTLDGRPGNTAITGAVVDIN